MDIWCCHSKLYPTSLDSRYSKPMDEYPHCTEGAIDIAGKMKQVSTINTMGPCTGLDASAD